jgi:hypothetical protein
MRTVALFAYVAVLASAVAEKAPLLGPLLLSKTQKAQADLSNRCTLLHAAMLDSLYPAFQGYAERTAERGEDSASIVIAHVDGEMYAEAHFVKAGPTKIAAVKVGEMPKCLSIDMVCESLAARLRDEHLTASCSVGTYPLNGELLTGPATRYPVFLHTSWTYTGN